MIQIRITDSLEMQLFEDKSGELCYTVVDHSKLFNRKKYFDTKTLENPNYIRQLKQEKQGKQRGKNKGKEIVFDTTMTIPDFNYNHDIKKFKKDFNQFVVADEKNYEELKRGEITYAKDEINELRHKIDDLPTEIDKIDAMLAIQINKRHSKYLARVTAESNNRANERDKGHNSMSYFRLSYISQTYAAYLYKRGNSCESLENYMSLKNGYLHERLSKLKQHVKRKLLIPFASNLAWYDDFVEDFKQLPPDTGKNLDDFEKDEIKQEFIRLGDIKLVAKVTRRSEKTVRKWVDELQKQQGLTA